MSSLPTEGQETDNFIWECRFFSEGSTHTDYSQVKRTSSYGDELNLWSGEWTAEDINSPEFAVAFRVTPAASATITVHEIRVTICYELAGAKGTVSSLIGTGLRGVTAKGPRKVAVGVEGRIFTSDDQGDTWTQRTSPVTNGLLEVDYRNGEYIAVGENGAVITSADGITWAREIVGSAQDFFSVLAGDQILLGGTNEELLFGPELDDLETGRTVDDVYALPE